MCGKRNYFVKKKIKNYVNKLEIRNQKIYLEIEKLSIECPQSPQQLVIHH